MFRKKGKLILITGPMYAGKTRHLIHLYNVLIKDKKKAVALKAKLDIRTSTIKSRNGEEIIPTLVSGAKEIYEVSKNKDYIFIDEFHFFDFEIIEVFKKFKKIGKTLIISGLDKDFLKKDFEMYIELRKIADQEIKMTAVCHTCGRVAKYSRKIGSNKKNASPNSSRIEVDAEKNTRYFSACDNCHPVK